MQNTREVQVSTLKIAVLLLGQRRNWLFLLVACAEPRALVKLEILRA